MYSGPEGFATMPPPDVSRAPGLIAVTTITTSIAIILTMLRLYVRVRMVKLLGLDDAFNFVSTISATVMSGLLLAAISFGLGRHFLYVGIDHAIYSLELQRIAQFFANISTITFKIAVALFLTRFLTIKKPWKIAIWVLVGVNTAVALIPLIYLFVQCHPVQYLWDKRIPGGWCYSENIDVGTVIAQSTMAALTDFTLALLPVVFLWNVKIDRTRKVAVCAVMSLGVGSGIAAVVRAANVGALRHVTDPTWDTIPTFVAAIVEANLGIIAATLPSLAPLLKAANEARSRQSSKKSKSNTSGSTGMREAGQVRKPRNSPWLNKESLVDEEMELEGPPEKPVAMMMVRHDSDAALLMPGEEAGRVDSYSSRPEVPRSFVSEHL